jgi:hypothetical protein
VRHDGAKEDRSSDLKPSSSLAVQEMRVGPSNPGFRTGVQITTSCVGSMVEVVSVVGKGGRQVRQVSLRKASGSEPLMKHRNSTRCCRNQGLNLPLGPKLSGHLITGWVATGVEAARS